MPSSCQLGNTSRLISRRNDARALAMRNFGQTAFDGHAAVGAPHLPTVAIGWSSLRQIWRFANGAALHRRLPPKQRIV